MEDKRRPEERKNQRRQQYSQISSFQIIHAENYLKPLPPPHINASLSDLKQSSILIF